MAFKSIALAITIFAFSTSVNASVINTLNGIDYEWLELTATQGLSRTQVEAQLIDVNSSLYGYQYASRALVETLFLTYVPWDGVSGYHADSTAVAGAVALIADFGATYTDPGNGINEQFNSVDGFTGVNYDGYDDMRGLYGSSAECGTAVESCDAYVQVYRDAAGADTLALLKANRGFDDTDLAPFLVGNTVTSPLRGSFLVRSTVVPVPPAVLLFGSGIIGLIGVARRKK